MKLRRNHKTWASNCKNGLISSEQMLQVSRNGRNSFPSLLFVGQVVSPENSFLKVTHSCQGQQQHQGERVTPNLLYPTWASSTQPWESIQTKSIYPTTDTRVILEMCFCKLQCDDHNHPSPLKWLWDIITQSYFMVLPSKGGVWGDVLCVGKVECHPPTHFLLLSSLNETLKLLFIL